jgi:ribokinase
MISIAGTILVAGNLTEDILAWPVDTVTFDATTWVRDIVTSFGGNGANTSYAIAKLGCQVRFAGLVGSDAAGHFVLARLAEAGVELRVERSALPTPVSVVVVRSDGARAFLHRPGASRESFPEPITFTADLIAGATHFHLANPFGMPKMRVHGPETLRRAHTAGLTTSLDTGWDALSEWDRVIGPCLPHLDLLFVNESEARMLSGHQEPAQAAAHFLAAGTRAVVLKLGAQGCRVFERDADTAVPGFKVEAVDSTGAGDCFVGAFLAGLRHGLDPFDAARLANAAGALNVQHVGATTGLLDYGGTRHWAGL